jgi:hypothetical protein
MKKGKHKNTKIVHDGVTFDSKRELNRWIELKLLHGARKIRDLQRQVVFDLVPSVILDGRKKPAIRYIADAVYVENGIRIVEDTKSPHLRKSPVYRIKKHLMKHFHGLDIKEV